MSISAVTANPPWNPANPMGSLDTTQGLDGFFAAGSAGSTGSGSAAAGSVSGSSDPFQQLDASLQALLLQMQSGGAGATATSGQSASVQANADSLVQSIEQSLAGSATSSTAPATQTASTAPTDPSQAQESQRHHHRHHHASEGTAGSSNGTSNAGRYKRDGKHACGGHRAGDPVIRHGIQRRVRIAALTRPRTGQRLPPCGGGDEARVALRPLPPAPSRKGTGRPRFLRVAHELTVRFRRRHSVPGRAPATPNRDDRLSPVRAVPRPPDTPPPPAGSRR